MFGRKDVDFAIRIAPEEESGNYAIAEVAFINIVDDEEYITSAGVAFRKDHMTPDVRKKRDKALRAERARKEARKSEDKTDD